DNRVGGPTYRELRESGGYGRAASQVRVHQVRFENRYLPAAGLRGARRSGRQGARRADAAGEVEEITAAMEGAENDGRQAVHATRYVVGVLATVAGLLLMWYFRDIVGYIVASAVLAIIGAPLVKLMRKVRVKGRSLPGWLAAL